MPEHHEKELRTDPIPSELVNVFEVHQRRIQRRKEVFNEFNKETAKALEPLVATHKKAVREYEDHFDDGLLKYGRDPNKMPFDDRDPKEVKKARILKRAIEDAAAVVRNKEAELAAELKQTREYTAFKTAQTEYEDWLAKVCMLLKCCAADLDWQQRQVKRPEAKTERIPVELLAVPKD